MFLINPFIGPSGQEEDSASPELNVDPLSSLYRSTSPTFLNHYLSWNKKNSGELERVKKRKAAKGVGEAKWTNKLSAEFPAKKRGPHWY